MLRRCHRFSFMHGNGFGSTIGPWKPWYVGVCGVWRILFILGVNHCQVKSVHWMRPHWLAISHERKGSRRLVAFLPRAFGIWVQPISCLVAHQATRWRPSLLVTRSSNNTLQRLRTCPKKVWQTKSGCWSRPQRLRPAFITFPCSEAAEAHVLSCPSTWSERRDAGKPHSKKRNPVMNGPLLWHTGARRRSEGGQHACACLCKASARFLPKGLRSHERPNKSTTKGIEQRYRLDSLVDGHQLRRRRRPLYWSRRSRSTSSTTWSPTWTTSSVCAQRTWPAAAWWRVRDDENGVVLKTKGRLIGAKPLRGPKGIREFIEKRIVSDENGTLQRWVRKRWSERTPQALPQSLPWMVMRVCHQYCRWQMMVMFEDIAHPRQPGCDFPLSHQRELSCATDAGQKWAGVVLSGVK